LLTPTPFRAVKFGDAQAFFLNKKKVGLFLLILAPCRFSVLL